MWPDNGPMLAQATDRDSIVRGRHRFTDPDLAQIAASEGTISAWKAGFERFGSRVLDRVQGDFSVSFVAESGTRFAAVDRFAIHPLCWRDRGTGVEVADRADELARQDASIDLQAIYDYFYFHMIPAPRTVYRGIQRLPAGHCLVARQGETRVERWWRPRFVEDGSDAFEDRRDEFRKLLWASVRDHFDGRRVGCFLSGGTDSSTIAGILSEVTGRPARTYSIGFAANGYDEMAYARIAARHFRTDHHEYYVTPDDVARSIQSLAASYDQPFGNSSLLPAYYCAKLAHDDGIELMLAGDGGDELFGGNARYAGQRVFEAWSRVPKVLRDHVLEPTLLRHTRLQRLPIVRKAASYVEQANTPMPGRMQRHNLLLHLGQTEVFTADFLSSVDIELPSRQQRDVYDDVAAETLINRMLGFDWRYTLADNDLPKVVGAARQADVPVAFPFLDDRLVDFSLLLPPEYKVRRSQLRWFFKESLRGFLPDQIIAKKKHGFGLPFGVWAIEHKGLRDLAFDAARSFGARGLVRSDFVSRLTDDLLPRHPGYYGEMVWILMVAEMWLQAHNQADGNR